MTQEFNETRTGLANNFAAAGADLLAYMGSASALAAIPDTEPPRYVVAGTLADIVKLLPAADMIKPSTAGAAKGGITSLEGLTQYNLCPTGIGAEMREAKEGRYFKVFDVERLLATTAGEQAEPEQALQKTFAERLYGSSPDIDQRRDALYTMALIFAAAETDSARDATFEDMFKEFCAVPRMSVFDSLTRHTGAEIAQNYTFEAEEFFEVEAVERLLADHAQAALAAPEQVQAVSMSASEIEVRFKHAGGRWQSEGYWVIEDADLVPFARMILSAPIAAAPAAEEVQNGGKVE